MLNMVFRSSRLIVLSMLAGSLAIPMQSLAEDAIQFEIILTDKGFEPNEVKAPANRPLVITVKNTTKAAAEFESKSLKIEKVVAANGQGIFRVKPLAAGKYLFVNEYKEDTVKGYLIVE